MTGNPFKFNSNPKKLIYQFIRYLTVCTLSLSLQSCLNEPVEPLRVAFHDWPGYEPLHLARELGFYQTENIHLYELTSATSSIKAFRNGFLDVAALTLDEALLLVQDQISVTILVVMDVSNGADALISRPELSDLNDLKGKRIGVENMALGAYFLTRTLQIAGLAETDLEPVFFPVDQHEWAYQNNKVDALITFEPVKSKIQQAGAQVLLDSRQLKNEIVDILVINNKALQRKSTAVKELIEGWFKAVDYLQKEPLKAAQIIAPRIQITPEQYLLSLQDIVLPDRNDNKLLLSGSSPHLYEISQNMANILSNKKLLSRAISTKQMFNPKITDLLINNSD